MAVAYGLITATPAHSADLSPAPDGGVSGTTNVGSPENQPASSPEIAQGQGLGMMLGGGLAANVQAAQSDDKVALTFGTGIGAGATSVTYSETGVPPSSNVSLNSNVGLGIGRVGFGYSKVDNSRGQQIETVTFPGHDGQFALSLNSTSIVTTTDKKTGEVSTAITNNISQGKSIGANKKFGIAASVLVNANVVFDKFTGKVVVDEENLALLRWALEKLDFKQVDDLVNDFKAMNLHDVIDQKFNPKKAQELREVFGLGPIPGPEPSPFRSPPMPEPNPFGPAAPDKASLGDAEVAGGPGSALGPGGVSPADPSSPAGGAAAASGGHTSAGDASESGVGAGVAGGPGSSLGPGGVSPADPSSPAGGAAAASGGHTSAGDASESGVGAGVADGPGSSLGPGGISPADPSSPAGGAAAASGGHTDSVSSDASDGVSDGVAGTSDAGDGVGAGDSGASDAGDSGVGTGTTGDSGMAGGTSGTGDGSGSDGGGTGSDGGASGF